MGHEFILGPISKQQFFLFDSTKFCPPYLWLGLVSLFSGFAVIFVGFFPFRLFNFGKKREETVVFSPLFTYVGLNGRKGAGSMAGKDERNRGKSSIDLKKLKKWFARDGFSGKEKAKNSL